MGKFKSSKKRKRSAIVETSMAGDRSSSDSDPDSKSKKFKNNEEEESTLNGDDVPLVEEMVEDLLDEDSVESPKIAVNADNFMHTVMQMNKAQSDDDEFATKLREDFGLKSKKKTSQNNKKLKIDNGLNVVAVDEELIKSKKKIKKESEPKKDSGSVEEGKKCF